MRNVLAFLLPALLYGCTAKPGTDNFTPKLDTSYTVEAHLDYADTSADLRLTRQKEGIWDAEFSAPNTLAGVTLSFDGNAVGASYQGLQFTVPKSAMPAKTVLVTVTGILDAVAGQDALNGSMQEDGTWQYAGNLESARYTVTFDAAGQLAGLELPDQPAKLSFQGYTVASSAETTQITTISAAATGTASTTTVSTVSAGSTTSTGGASTSASKTTNPT